MIPVDFVHTGKKLPKALEGRKEAKKMYQVQHPVYLK